MVALARRLCAAALVGIVIADHEYEVTLHRIVNAECGQLSTVNRRFEIGLLRLGLEEGTCTDKGFTQVMGKKDMNLPVVGQVEMEIFKKPNLLGLALTVAGITSAASARTDPCCTTCPPPLEKFYSVDEKKGHCGEACLQPGSFFMHKLFEPNLQRVNDKSSCASLGWVVYGSTVTHGIPPLTTTLDLYHMPPPGSADKVTLYKVADGLCGEAAVGRRVAPAALELHGLEEGFCRDHGFTVTAGSEEVHAPLIGDATLTLYKKAGVLDLVDAFRLSKDLLTEDTVTLIKVGDGVCAEATIDKKLKDAMERFTGFTKGTCREEGFTEPAGNKDISSPLVGDVKLAVYRAGPQSGQRIGYANAEPVHGYASAEGQHTASDVMV